MSKIEEELAKYEFASAKRVWDALDSGQQRMLSRLLIHGYIWPDRKEVEDPNGSITHMDTGKKYRMELVEDPFMNQLMNMHLAIWGRADGNWGVNGPPAVYRLSAFGQIVARYGEAKSIVELAETT